jgi:hypothetical protein
VNHTLNRINSIPKVTVYSGEWGSITATMLEMLLAKVQKQLTNFELAAPIEDLFEALSCCSASIWSNFEITSLG